jgi:hypothetical protein
MKYLGHVSLWNRDQWAYIRFPHNWLRWKFESECPEYPVMWLTVLGFTCWFSLRR